jgi:flagellar capping protein FliD
MAFHRLYNCSNYAIIELTSKQVIQRAKGRFSMPTQEERLTILEYGLKQYKTETIKAYGEMAIEMTLVKGLTEDAVKRLASLKSQIEQRFERVDTRLDAMDVHLESMDTRLNQMDTRLDRVENVMDTRLNQMDTRLDRVENLLAQILARLPEKP